MKATSESVRNKMAGNWRVAVRDRSFESVWISAGSTISLPYRQEAHPSLRIETELSWAKTHGGADSMNNGGETDSPGILCFNWLRTQSLFERCAVKRGSHLALCREQGGRGGGGGGGSDDRKPPCYRAS
jgi:hypothetical protein